MELQKYTPNEVAGYTGEIMRAKEAKKVKDMDIKNLHRLVKECIQRAYLELKYNEPEVNEKALSIVRVADDLNRYFYTFTSKEVEICFSMGVRGYFGEVKGLSIAVFNKWLKTYMYCNERQEANKKIKEPFKPKELTEKEKEQLVIDGILNLWDRYQMLHHVDDIGNVAYNYLDGKGLIKFTNEEKKAFYADAQVEEKGIEKRKKETAGSLIERRDIDRRIQELEGSKAPRAVILAKKKALNEFFKRLKAENKSLKDLLTTNS